VVDRRHGKGLVAEFSSPARFFFHAINAFEDDTTGDILCEVVDYPNRYVIDGFYYDIVLNRNGAADKFWTAGQLEHQSFPRLSRYRLPKKQFTTNHNKPLPTPELILEIPSPHAGEMPVINPNYQCRRHRYVYFAVSRARSTLFDALAKVDTETGEVLQWEGPHGHTPGEAIFVPRPAPVDGKDGEGVPPGEDDGVLLSVVLDGANRMSYLLCLDARTMTELGRAECEFAVAIGLHGCHLPAA
jgi:torulene dioxygenase